MLQQLLRDGKRFLVYLYILQYTQICNTIHLLSSAYIPKKIHVDIYNYALLLGAPAALAGLQGIIPISGSKHHFICCSSTSSFLSVRSCCSFWAAPRSSLSTTAATKPAVKRIQRVINEVGARILTSKEGEFACMLCPAGYIVGSSHALSREIGIISGMECIHISFSGDSGTLQLAYQNVHLCSLRTASTLTLEKM